MVITVHGITYRVQTEREIVALVAWLATQEAA